ncbi:hypothetical protein [Sphingomonas taxi]|uniref:hypothetical protein n=1 Tax=Sphingomonas taxi TaxID=1549858 RepID=UPI0006915D57|nr:hypothetical protein [Sphingomonas taxi]
MQDGGSKRAAGWRRTRDAGGIATRVIGVIGTLAASWLASSGAAQSLPNAATGGEARWALQPLALGSEVGHDARLTGNLRLRVTTIVTAPGPREKRHQRLGSSMLEFYPVEASGFHLSAGTRMYDPRAGEQWTNRALVVSAPRPLNVPGSRAGLRRTPTLTFGYTGALADRTRISVEIGAMKGSAYASATDATRRLRGERGAGNPVNPIVHLVVGRRF